MFFGISFAQNIIWLIKWKLKIKSLLNFFLNKKKFKLKKISDLKIKKNIIYKKEKIKINDPIFISKDNTVLNKNKNKIGYFPEIYIAQIDNANVIGKSNFFLKENLLVHHDLFDSNKDICLEEIQGRFLFSSNKKFCYYNSRKIKKIILKAASFTDSTSFNYAHWITEILPKIFVFCSKKKFKNIPIIIDKNLHKNYYESLKYVINKDRKIILIKKDENIKVKKLFIVSNCGYHPLRTSTNIIGNEGFFNYKLMERLKKAIKKKIRLVKQDKFSNFYIKRCSEQRILLNSDEIEVYLKNKNFRIIKGITTSFAKQFNYFYNAKIIVGPAGADFANLIFCKNFNTDVYVLSKKSPNLHGLYYWPTLFPYSKKKVKIILDHKKTFLNYIFPKIMLHENFNISLNLIKNSIKI